MDKSDLGYIMLYRKFQNNFLWKEKRVLSRAEAWIDILYEVRWEKGDPDKVIIGNKVITCGYAQSLNSQETWAKRWGWTRQKVQRFLNLLKQEGMIEWEPIAGKTIRLKVCNYWRYHNPRAASEQQASSSQAADGQQPGTEEEVKEEEERKKIEALRLQNDIDEILTLFETKVKGRKDDKAGSLKTRKKAIETLLKSGTPKEKLLMAVDNYAEDMHGTEPKFRKGAQTFFGPKFAAWRDYAKEDWRGPAGPIDHLTANQRLARREGNKFDGMD